MDEREDREINASELGISQLGTETPEPPVGILPRDPKGRIRWVLLKDQSPEVISIKIENEVRGLLAQGVLLTDKSLKGAKLSGLALGIRQLYPGGFPRLREKLAVEAHRKPYNYWTQENIEKEAQEFYEKEGNFSGTFVRQKRADLMGAIERKYSGGINPLRQKLKIEQKKTKPSGYWKEPKNIEQEASEVLMSQGKLTQRSIRAAGKPTLTQAIAKNYPDGMRGLVKKLGQEPTSKPKGYWTPETIEREAQEVLNIKGNLTYAILEEVDRHDLFGAIVNHYPGGIYKLKLKLSIHDTVKPRGYWTVEQIERDAEEFIKEYGNLSATLLQHSGNAALAHAISRYYPQGMKQLQKKFTVEASRKSSGYWTKENIEEEARKFVQMAGNLSYAAFRENQRNDLGIAVARKYPGGLKALRERLGIIKDQSTPILPANSDTELRIRLRNFSQEVVENKTLDAQEFRKLVGLFGSSRAVDILYRYRPDYRGLPVENVKSVLAEYLGEFLVTRGPLNIDDIETGLEYLSDPNFREGLVEVIKDSCLAHYHQTKKADPNIKDADIIYSYLDYIETELDAFDNENLRVAVEDTMSYYLSVVEGFQRPNNIVDELSKGRDFPDLNQQINIRELSDKRRILIADEMGIGKSASAILAKETLGLKTALIVTPSNVISTWKDYLSDKVFPNGKPVGYFKPGESPRILVIEDIDSLKESKLSEYDYILVSQEKLNDHYLEGLEEINIDMLVVDEIHKLKNIESGKRASNLLRLTQKVEGENKYLALLSGTPVPNKIEDVAMILRLLHPEKFAMVGSKELVKKIIHGDTVDLRSLLLPRMQMKSLVESVEMPVLTEHEVYVDLTSEERDIYETLLEEDELAATTKLAVLRQFLLNPEIFDLTPDVANSKIKAVGEKLNDIFSRKNKAVMFVNGYIEGVLRGNKTILDRLNLPDDVEVRVIEGDVGSQARLAIQADLNTSKKKILLIVSGQTADVGVDFSGGEAVVFFNEPWTKYEYRQQLGRVYRPGLSTELECWNFITRDTVEEGIHYYIEIKQRAIEKLLRGVPISDMERTLIKKSEEQVEPNLEVNPELARYYFSAWDKMMRKFFGYTREIGEKNFLKFLEKFGQEYAECYVDLGNRSYQSNAGRVTGTLVDQMAQETGQDISSLMILDIASGPEVLKKHIGEEYQDRVVSLDINQYHFQNPGSKRTVGSFTKLPFLDSSLDYTNLSLALHYTKFAPSQGEFERLEVLAEMNRVLKTGGKAIINMVYSLDFKDEDRFKTITSLLGFEVVQGYSGEVVSGNNYRSKVFTLRKVKDINDSYHGTVPGVSKEYWKGLKFTGSRAKVKESRKIIKDFSMDGKTLPVKFNPEDSAILKEEENVVARGEQLKSLYGGIKEISREDIISSGFTRLFNGKRYLLFKKLEKGSGVVIIK